MSKRNKAKMTEADEQVNGETFTLTLQRHMLDWVPVRPGSLRITINRLTEGVLSVTDDGHGTLRDGMNQDRGSVNYESGQVDLEDVPNGTPCLAQYAFDSSAPKKKAEINFTITSSPILAKTHKLKHHAKFVYNL